MVPECPSPQRFRQAGQIATVHHLKLKEDHFCSNNLVIQGTLPCQRRQHSSSRSGSSVGRER
jgi:hypothetical protein